MKLLIAAVVLLVAACGLAGPGASPTPTSPATAVPPASATAPPSAIPTPSAEATSSHFDEPPAATLTAGSKSVIGHLGTYCWRDACADTFQIPPKATLPDLELAAPSTLLTFALAADAPFFSWQASFGPGTMEELMPLAEGGQDFDPDTSATPPPVLDEAAFESPPSGDWVVYVVIRSIDGEAHYMWHVSVP